MHLTCKKHFSKTWQDRFGRLDTRNCVKEIFLRPCSKVHQVLMQLKLHWWPYTIPDCDNSAETKLKTNRRAGSRLSRMPLTRELKWCCRYVTRRPWWYPRIIWGASLDGASYVLSIPLHEKETRKAKTMTKNQHCNEVPDRSFTSVQMVHTHTLSHTEAFTHRTFYTETLLHTDAFTHRRFYTQTLLHTDAFTHRTFYTQTLLHTEPFTHRRFYAQTLLHTDAFTHRGFYTQTLSHTDDFTHRRFYTQTLLHTDAFTHKRFYTQTLTQRLLHTVSFTHRRFYTQKLVHTQTLLHTETFRPFYTQTLLHTDTFTHRLLTETFTHRDSFTHKCFHI